MSAGVLHRQPGNANWFWLTWVEDVTSPVPWVPDTFKNGAWVPDTFKNGNWVPDTYKDVEVPCGAPLPGTFNADPTPATCDAPGAFDVDLGGEFLTEYGNTTVYGLHDGDIRLAVTRTGLTVDLYVFSSTTACCSTSPGWTRPSGRSTRMAGRPLADRPAGRARPPERGVHLPGAGPFNADPTPPTCDAAAAFDSDFDGFVLDRNGVKFYDFADGTVRLSVDRPVDAW